HYDIWRCEDASCSVGCVDGLSVPGTSHTLTGVAHGEWYGCLRAVDVAGNKSAVASAGPVWVDLVAPPATTVTDPASWSNSAAVTWSWSAVTDDGVGLDHYRYEACTAAGC